MALSLNTATVLNITSHWLRYQTLYSLLLQSILRKPKVFALQILQRYIWRKKIAFEKFSTVYMGKRTLRSKIWRARTFETSWDFANYITKQLHFSYLEDISIKKQWFLGKCSNVVCEVSCWHKKIAIGLLASSAWTANKIGVYRRLR